MAAPIPSNLAFKSAGVNSLQSNLANWVLQSDNTTPALRVPVATDSVAYPNGSPSDSLSGFNLQQPAGFLISGTGTVSIPFEGPAGLLTLVAGGSPSLFLAGPTTGDDLSLVGTSPSSRLIFSGADYAETGDDSGNIQNTNFSGDLDVENNSTTYDSIKVGGNFTTANGLVNPVTNIEVLGTSEYQSANTGLSLASGIFHGLASAPFGVISVNTGTFPFTGTFYGGQAMTAAPGYSSTLYDQQYVDSQTAAHQLVPFLEV